MNIIYWIIFGLITGVIANILDPHPDKGGWLGAILLGILGAMLGGYLGSMIFGIGLSGFNFPSFAVAILGALLLLFLGRIFSKA